MKYSIALLMVLSALCLVSCSSTDESNQYEYTKVYDLNAVNKAAAQGWRVVGYASRDVVNNGEESYILERRIRK